VITIWNASNFAVPQASYATARLACMTTAGGTQADTPLGLRAMHYRHLSLLCQRRRPGAHHCLGRLDIHSTAGASAQRRGDNVRCVTFKVLAD
jgi:hypothetical protein